MPDGRRAMFSIIGPPALTIMFFVVKLLGICGVLQNGKELTSASGSFSNERIDSLSRQTI
jgi:hypothetical protein